MLYLVTKGQLSIDPWGVSEQELLKFPCLPRNIDSLASAVGTFSREIESFLVSIATFLGPADSFPLPNKTFP